MNKIRTGDEVIVICGKDKGRRGNVSQILDNKIIVTGINQAKKHVKPNPNAGVDGGIVTKDMPIAVSNVMLINPATDKGDRVGIKQLEDGKRVRFFKSNNEIVST